MKNEIISFIKTTVHKCGYKGALVGISGGIDSAVAAALCVEALGKDNVYGLLLPERDSDSNTVKDSKLVCDFLDIKYELTPISPALKSMGVYSMENNFFFIPKKLKQKVVKNRWNPSNAEDTYLSDLSNIGDEKFLRGLAYYRVKHRIRMCYLYLKAEQLGYAVVGTTNKTELDTGFYVKWGDDAVDIEPLMHLYKTQVYELANILNIPDKIICKPPSPDLIPGITDEYALGISYTDLDRILKKINNNTNLHGEDKLKVDRVRNILKAAKGREIRMVSLNKNMH